MTTTILPSHFVEYHLDSKSGNVIAYQGEHYPSSYLEFARSDMDDGDSARHHINAVSNAKRALHQQVEGLCDALGFALLHKKNAQFPRKLDFLPNCGVISPRILAKLNTLRNKVEHDYYTPTRAEAEDYVDVVELFVLATKLLSDFFPTDLDFALMKDDYYDPSLALPEHLHIDFDWKSGTATVSANRVVIRQVTFKDPNYLEWIGAIMRHYFY